jgi:hypothetical protein
MQNFLTPKNKPPKIIMPAEVYAVSGSVSNPISHVVVEAPRGVASAERVRLVCMEMNC